MNILFQDIRFALRTLARSPWFTAIALVTLALGIGANTAIFSVVNATLFRSLPYGDPDRLVMLWGENAKDGNREQPHSFADLDDIIARSQSFDNIAAISPVWSFVLAVGSEPEPIQGHFASANLFQTLGVAPMLGRSFSPDEDKPNGARAVVVSYALWQQRFGSDQNVIGRALALDGNSYNIIGVMPAGFRFVDDVELWVPLRQNPFVTRGRDTRLLSVVGRMKIGLTQEQAKAEAKTIAARLASQYPDSNTGIGANAVGLQEQLTGKTRPTLLILLGAVAFVLLIACANVANLMLVRASSRTREVAVRVALGSGRARLIRQLLTESVVVAAVGGICGLALAYWGIDVLIKVQPANLPRVNPIAIDRYVLGFTVLVSAVTGVLFGLAPAIQATHIDVNNSLREGSRGGHDSPGAKRLRRALIVSEIALALVLLIGAGLLFRSFVRVLDVDPGYATDRTLTLQVNFPAAQYQRPEQRVAAYLQVEDRLKAIPGVVSVGSTTRLPLQTRQNNVTSFVLIEGRTMTPSERSEVDFRRVTPNYFATMAIPIRSGRLFTDQDVTQNTTASFVMVNEAFAQKFWPGEDAIGKRFKSGPNLEQSPWSTVVGVVGNVRHLGLDVDPRPEMYLHLMTNPPFGPVIAIRTSVDPKSLISSARSAIRGFDQTLPIANIATMDDLVGRSVAQRKFVMSLIGVFALIAMVLAAVGIYGVIAFSVARRTREIGVRVALGASNRDVIVMILGEALGLSGLGVVIGVAGAFALTRLMTGLLFGVQSSDPLTFAGVAVSLLIVALTASYVPARRATKVDPMVALRCE